MFIDPITVQYPEALEKDRLLLPHIIVQQKQLQIV